MKFFLNVSKDEQKRRFLERINDPKPHWKFAAGDVRERQHWDDYQRAYEQMLLEVVSKPVSDVAAFARTRVFLPISRTLASAATVLKPPLETSTPEAPWYALPAGQKGSCRTLASRILVQAIDRLDVKYAQVRPEQSAALNECRQLLESESRD